MYKTHAHKTFQNKFSLSLCPFFLPNTFYTVALESKNKDQDNNKKKLITYAFTMPSVNEKKYY